MADSRTLRVYASLESTKGEQMPTTSVIVLALIIGLLPAFIARSKGYSFGAWWLFGAAIFIVALPLALLSKPNSRKFRSCPHCMSRVPALATACPHCTRYLEPLPTRVSVRCAHCDFRGDVDVATHRWDCPSCGKSTKTLDSLAAPGHH